jgi:hypothetical protein
VFNSAHRIAAITEADEVFLALNSSSSSSSSDASYDHIRQISVDLTLSSVDGQT